MTEKDWTPENFDKLLEDTYSLVRECSGKEILNGLCVYSFHWDHQYFLNYEVKLIINALSIFITKVDPVQGKKFDSFNGFNDPEGGEEMPFLDVFINRLAEFKPEYLSIENWLFIQEIFDELILFDDKHGKIPKQMYDYVNNMVQIRIAIEIYNEKTGYRTQE